MKVLHVPQRLRWTCLVKVVQSDSGLVSLHWEDGSVTKVIGGGAQLTVDSIPQFAYARRLHES